MLMRDANTRCLPKKKNERCKAGKVFWCLGTARPWSFSYQSPVQPLGKQCPDPTAGSPQPSSPGAGLETRVLAGLPVTSLPPGHSSSNICPLQCITPCLNLESFQCYLDCKVWVSLGNSSTCTLVYLARECRASTAHSDKSSTDRAMLTELFTPGRTVIVTRAQQLISVLLKSY